jgi:hypothetical protein
LIGPLQKKKLKLWRLLKIEDSMERRSILWPQYIGEKGRTLGKTYGIKERCYWEHRWGTHWEPREHIGNVMRTHWELKGTCWEQRKNEKNPPPQRKLKKIKSRHFEYMLSLPIGCMKFW